MSRYCLVLALIFAGCGQPPAPVVKKTTTTTAPTQANTIDSVKEELKRPFAEPDQLRFALDRLSTARDKVSPLDAATVDFLKTKLQLTDADIREINRPEFGPLDAHLLYQGLFFADAARMLELGKAKPLEKATAALEWVNRHVRLEERDGPPDPPTLVAQRGSGTALERIYVMVALCQALDLDVFVVGDAEAASNPSRNWGVGIIDNKEVALFDPRLGIPLPGAKGIATLGELSKDASSLKPLNDLGYDVTPERAKSAKLYYGFMLSTLAPRMKAVEQLAPPGTDVAINAALLAELATKLPINGWDPKTRGTPIRVMSEFLPPEEGGVDKPLPGQLSRFQLYTFTLVPWSEFPQALFQIPGFFGARLSGTFKGIAACDREQGIGDRMKRRTAVEDAFRAQISQEKETPSDPRLQNDIVNSLSRGLRATGGDDQGPTLRQLMLRGQFREATEATSTLSDLLRTVRKRDGAALAPAVEAWTNQVRKAYFEGQSARQSGNAAGLAAAEQKLAELRKGLPQADAFVQWLAAGPALAKLAYLTALVKHDEAVAKARRDNSPEVWKTPIALWDSYSKNHPGTLESLHAQRLLGDALLASGQKAAAAAAYKKVADNSKNAIDKVACGYLAATVNK